MRPASVCERATACHPGQAFDYCHLQAAEELGGLARAIPRWGMPLPVPTFTTGSAAVWAGAARCALSDKLASRPDCVGIVDLPILAPAGPRGAYS